MSLHLDHLNDLHSVAGRHVVDVGAGSGGFICELVRKGATATGLEPNARTVEAAGPRLPPGAVLLEAYAQDVPLPDASADVVSFIFSLHHVPINHMDRALDEAHRILRSGGRLHVVEPHIYGTMTEVVNHLDNETDVRNASHERLARLGDGLRFCLLDQRDYSVAPSFRSFEELLDRLVANDPDRAAKLPNVRARMERVFHAKAVASDGLFRFDQPCRAYHFETAGPQEVA